MVPKDRVDRNCCDINNVWRIIYNTKVLEVGKRIGRKWTYEEERSHAEKMRNKEENKIM